MNWYMKHEATGAIAGPMTKDEALAISENGLIFSENIFSPQFVTTSEVDDVLTSLRVLRGLTQEDRDFNQLLEEITVVSQRAIDTITLLCCENPKPVDFSVRVLLAELQGLREAKEIIRGGEDDAIGTLLGQVMSALIRLSAKKVDTTVTEVPRVPQFVITSEVDTLLQDLRDVRGYPEDGPPRDSTEEALSILCQRAIDTITLLCGKARRVELEMDVDVARLMLDLDKVLVGELRERAAKAIISLSAKKVEAPLSSQEVLKRMQQDLPGIIEELIEKQLRDNPL